MAELFDIERTSEFWHACGRWALGDAAAIADFVSTYGVHSEHERAEVARMLTSKPDPRKALKPATLKVLQHLDTSMRRRDEVLRMWPELTQGLSGSIRKPTQADVFDGVAKLHRMEPEAVAKLWRRHRRKHKT